MEPNSNYKLDDFASNFDQMESLPCGSLSKIGDVLTNELAVTVIEKKKFHVDASKIQSVPVSEQNDELQNLGLQVYNQETFEQGVLAQVDEQIENEERDHLCRVLNRELLAIDEDIRLCQLELADTEKMLNLLKESKETKETKHRLISIQSRQRNAKSRLQTLTVRRKMTLNKITAALSEDFVSQEQSSSRVNQILEASGDTTEQEDLVRRGEMTPFGTLTASQISKRTTIANNVRGSSVFGKKQHAQQTPGTAKKNLEKKTRLKRDSSSLEKTAAVSQGRNNSTDDCCWEPQENSDEDEYTSSEDEMIPNRRNRKRKAVNDLDCNEERGCLGKVRFRRSELSELTEVDDGDLELYEQRVREHHKRELRLQKEGIVDELGDVSDMEIDNGFKVPARIWNKLHRYQKTGVRWLWELHCQQAGGILGDEMGLGKTIQIIAFLAGLSYSKLRDKAVTASYTGLGPVLIVCPPTVMHQWVKEFHVWWPMVRAAVLHSTGSYKSTEAELIKGVVRSRGVLVTAYSTVVIQQNLLLGVDWHYVILDEGHKIRNPDAQITLACKQFRTCHRIILSGSPMQNNLKELWSLFDFVFPGKLGALPDFMQHFSVPIIQGGYANATEIQVQTAYKCACVLRDTVAPYLLRRMKADVKNSLQLPDKNEQVLFCRLTDEQRQIYKEYLDSKECHMILNGKYMVFPGLITLRKICNHPDLSTGGPKVFDSMGSLQSSNVESDEYGYWKRSGKMFVIDALLKLWKKQQHKVLLFTQSRQMLDILESYVKEHEYSFLRMDGTTSISSRQPMVSRFNDDDTIFLFLLTTRVGGLGVNLTGADRVVIFDPDWNPSTDSQARERAWRIGQSRPVTVYRLLTTGTIEEKIYHRQIFKQFLTNRILKDPKQRRFFKSNDLFELFTLGNDNPSDGTETSAIFAGLDVDVKLRKRKSARHSATVAGEKFNRFDYLKQKATELGVVDGNENENEREDSDDERVTRIRELAKLLSQKMTTTQRNNTSLSNGNVSTTALLSSDDANKTQSESKDSINVFKSEVSTGDTHMPTGMGSEDNNGDTRMPTSMDVNSSVTHTQNQKASLCIAAGDEPTVKKHLTKRHKHKRRAVIDGEKITNLVQIKPYIPPNDVPEKNDQDDYVLHRLLKKSGVHSAMMHDRIMQSSNPDYMLVECEAERVARNAARALQVSRQRCMASLPVGVPTWTGQNGLNPATKGGRFGKKKNPSLVVPGGTAAKDNPKSSQLLVQTAVKEKRNTGLDEFDLFGGAALLQRSVANGVVSSSELIAQLRSKRPLSPDGTDNLSDNDQTSQLWTSPDAGSDELIRDIRDFVACGASIDGQATTNEILDKFRSCIPIENTAKFKSMLKQVCSFCKIDGVGVWKLKPEYI